MVWTEALCYLRDNVCSARCNPYH
ncbi:MAG: hypothetical protein EA361_17405 [Bacteroidetes bacterium]|nr:MAG: hypothetical protein EA361_17405 [Bacteroidota bacterium]